MKKRLKNIAILAGVFVFAVILFSYITNKGNTDLTADMEAATLPRISFETGGYTVNSLAGYTREMDLTAMRDTVTPLTVGGEAMIRIDAYENEIQKFRYEVFSLNGKNLYGSGVIKDVEEAFTLNLDESLPDDLEGVLKITIEMDKSEDVYYYTRIKYATDYRLKACMDFVNDFHTKALAKTETESLSLYLEANEESDNTTYQTVTDHSDLTHVTWGSLKPQLQGEVQWSIEEANSTYSSYLLTYQVLCEGDEVEQELFNVREFFRVRELDGTMILMDYNRTMNQVFNGTQNTLMEKGINLGVTPHDVEYSTNKDGTITAFVQERELWCYDKEADQLSLVFSFANSEKQDIRNLYDQHDIRIIEMKESGSATFAVYGYMNRGEHEGEVGAAIYYFDIEKNSVEEKAFIPSDKSYVIAREDLGKLVYYNQKEEMLYVMVDGTLYQVNLDNSKREVIVENLKEGQYVASDDGHLMAYQSNGSLDEATIVTVRNFASGKEYSVEVAEDECIRPQGFVRNDFVYGVAKLADIGKTVSGESVTAMYKLEIRDSSNEVVKTYQLDQIYVLDTRIEDNMITLERVTKNGELFTGAGSDYITNNEEKAEGNITLGSYSTELKGAQMRLIYEDGIKDQKAKLLKPKQVLFENPPTIEFEPVANEGKFYVYGRGTLLGIYDKAAPAVKLANEVYGVVVSSSQAYVWERGNRILNYELESAEVFDLAEGETSLAGCIRNTLEREGNSVDVTAQLAGGESTVDILGEYTGGEALDLTGCSVEEMLYIIGRGTPVIALLNHTNAILLVGYGNSLVTYIDPAAGEKKSVPLDTIDEVVEGSGHTFLGYVK